ncbi:MAG: hypothetical protein NW220_17535 [Leptolyngbyaceae cyanobacterium bins.349]|nr:hypothetical protein [Leptolyngbyaceae cyanobacterium bins.349]
MFRVVTHEFDQEFARWTDALNTAKALIPACKSWTQDIRIFLCDELIWLYCLEYKYPKYIGAGTYNRLAQLFIQELLEAEAAQSNSP